ncbi:MAG: cob(I)yrinic acid a,c-diamide adenosyltransferase [Chloroflexi bacterium]|jgi:cob(I)alamin adenosyltransferase|nr:cob(I)yrinic acid a,c-diamide adenosyltransferase [Chloroflexota bacterium]
MVTARAGRGDDGTTDLLGRRRVSKGSVAIDALGDLDEATSSIGLARAHVGEIDSAAAALLEQVQRDLYEAMAEVAIPVSRAGGHRIDDARLDWLTTTCEKVDLATPTPTQFVLPGATIVGAQLDVARTVVRRAERTVVRMLDASDSDPGADLPTNRLLGAYLNRLSTLLYLLARGADHATGRAPEFARRARLS